MSIANQGSDTIQVSAPLPQYTNGHAHNHASAETEPILTEDERNRLLYEWNNTRAEFPDVCVHALFEQQAARTPDAPAIVFQGQELSYRSLNQRANQLARYLRKRGIGPEVLVGVCLERTPEMLIGLLGIWKAGGAYVPLDPTYPPERLSFMLKDSAATLLLTGSRHQPLFPSAADKTILLDSDWPLIAQENNRNLKSGAVPSNLAYVMYTSGSTGEPKGAMILHSGLVNYLCWAIKAYGVEEGGSVPVHSSISFDLTVTSMYPALLAGGKIELLPEDVGAQNLLAALRQGGNRSLVKITPAHLELLSQAIKPTEAAGMSKTFVIGGENLLAESLKLWRDSAPGTRLINEYGPTETVVGCCVHEVNGNDPRNGSVPIGRPIANTELYILDAQMNPVPPGVTGELYIGGAGVARGYLNRPELTQQKFIPDPFSRRSGARLYKTGDLARYRKDGILEFLGRIDSQVKVRGYRIELGEIEATLADHPAVNSCAVLAREDEPGDKQLVGYVIPAGNESPTVDDLRQFLLPKLPEYMVPAHFVVLESFPLTPNGKVDRKAFPPPGKREHRNIQAAQEFVRPQTETERALAAIWTEVLKVEHVGINDDFFDLGGHSLLAIKVMSRIRDVFEVDLQTQTLFESPTIAGLATALKEAKGSSQDVQRIEPRAQSGPSSLSFAQEQLWFLDQMAAGSPVYNVVDFIRFEGAFHSEALKKAVNELVRRHEILRTAFSQADGPIQIVQPAADVKLSELDLSSSPEQDREREWLRVVHDQGRKTFDLSQAPLFRGTIVHLGQEHRLLLVLHHIIVDEWSMELVHQEVNQLYQAFSQGLPSPLPELPIQFADFASWQRNWLQGEVLERQTLYWKEQLAGAPTVLELPTDKPRPAVQSFRGASERFALPKDLMAQLKSLGREQQSTLFMILEASFMALLHRYTGQDDILVGTPISGRTHSETERLIGCFLNTVVLRAQFNPKLNFRTLLAQVRERALGAYAHPDLPFEHLVAELAPERDPSRTPLFQVMFILHNTEGVSQVSKVSGNQQLETGTSKFDLTLTMSESQDGLDGLVEYSTDLFETASIQRLCAHFTTLLKAVVRNPDRSLSTLPMLTAPEQKQLLTDCNNTEVTYPGQDLCLHQLFERQAEQSPDSVAAEFEQQKLTYAELDRLANQLAHHLKERGVGPDVLVGLFVERSPEMLVALLGILKAGGAYVPLDPSFPQNRIAHMVEDSKMTVLLTHRGLEEQLQVRPPVVIRLDSDWSEIAKHSATPVELPKLRQQDLAYVLYTSGSTGKPKGVAIPHGAIVNFLLSMQRKPGLSAGDTLLAVTTLSFDIAGLELYLPLVTGGKVVIASREDTHDPVRLLERMRESRCTVMQATPATWRALIHAGWTGTANLKILCGGEALQRDLANELLPRCEELWNMYGPTETTVWSTVHRITSAGGEMAIGQPIANTQVYVLDKYRNLVPFGAVGELYIGGTGLAREYLNRNELTKERFVPSPFAPATLLYRTGDLARWLPDQTLECLGRVDNQVKVRGFRIELGEIESVLAGHPAVKQCAVVVREDTPGDKLLVAYFEPKGAPVPAADLRTHLKNALPDYMIPSAFVPLERLPLTPNGKIDRKALPEPGQGVAETNTESMAPRDALDQMLVQVWSRILKVKRVGLRDNFFELGGHSLAAVRMMSEVRDLTGKTLPLATLFQAATVEALADLLRQDGWKPSWSSLVPIRPQGSKAPLFLVHGAEGNVLLYRQVTRYLDADQPVYGLQSQGLNGEGHLPTTLQEMASQYVREIRTVQPHGPYFLGGYCLGGVLAYEMAQQLTALGEKVELVMMVDTYNLGTVSRRKLRWQAPLHFLQNLWFHSANLALARGQGRGKFLRDKLDTSIARLGIRLRAAYHGLRRRNNYPHLMVKKLNDQAALQYVPQPYSGRVAVIRAKGHFAGQRSPSMGWAEFVNSGLEVHQLPVYPKGILVEPFCRQLAETLKSCLRNA